MNIVFEPLNDRKLKILEAVITDYVSTAEPVGSRTIAKKFDLGISSATIRNEMSDLEDMGFLSQPHASSGRVPNDKAYRFYVNRILREQLIDVLSGEEAVLLREIIRENVGRIDFLMKETAKYISKLTNLAAVATAPAVKPTRKFKRLQLTELDENAIILIVVAEDRDISNFVIDIPEDCPKPSENDLLKLSAALNAALQGAYNKFTFIGDSSRAEPRLEELFGPFAPLLPGLMSKAFSAISNADGLSVYTSGIKNLRSFPEFKDDDTREALFQTLEEKQTLLDILGGMSPADFDGIEVLIGGENAVADMRNCTVVKAHYKVGGGFGSVGVLGPTRMNYPQVVSVMDTIISNLRLALIEGGL